jgi:hypothetical protein
MTVTKLHVLCAILGVPASTHPRHIPTLLASLKPEDLLDTVYVDNGVDSIDCRAVEIVKNHDTPEQEHISTQSNCELLPEGSLVLRLAE